MDSSSVIEVGILCHVPPRHNKHSFLGVVDFRENRGLETMAVVSTPIELISDLKSPRSSIVPICRLLCLSINDVG